MGWLRRPPCSRTAHAQKVLQATVSEPLAKTDRDFQTASNPSSNGIRLWLKRIAFVSLLLFSLTLPSDWTQDIPARYGKRHAGMHYSRLYPHVEGNIPDSSK